MISWQILNTNINFSFRLSLVIIFLLLLIYFLFYLCFSLFSSSSFYLLFFFSGLWFILWQESTPEIVNANTDSHIRSVRDSNVQMLQRREAYIMFRTGRMRVRGIKGITHNGSSEHNSQSLLSYCTWLLALRSHFDDENLYLDINVQLRPRARIFGVVSRG